MVRTWKRGADNRHVRQQRETLRCDAGGNLLGRQRGPAPYTRRSAMHSSKLDIGGADAAARGMAISSGSSASACGGVPSSSSSDSSAMAHTGGPSSAGSVSRTTRQWRCSSLAPSTASRKSASVWARKRRHPDVHTWFMSPRSVSARAALSAEYWRRHALFKAKPSNEPSRTERA